MSRLRKDIESLALNKKKVKDYDPEDIDDAQRDDSSDASDQDDTSFGDREHYQAVGKSKLRKPETQVFDSKYNGVVVSRKALESDSDNDPFAAGPDDDDDDDPFAVAEKNDSGSESGQSIDHDNGSELSGADEEDGHNAFENDHSDDDDDDGQESLDQDMEDYVSDDEDESTSGNDTNAPSARGDLRAFLSNDSKNLASGLSQAAAADAAKGKAVKKQYQTFDRILDARMKLQKGLAASEDLITHQGATTESFTTEAQEALQAAQKSARQVFETITTFRESIRNTSTPNPISRKRKRANANELNILWQDLQQLEVESTPVRRATINKWSSREKAFDSTLANTKSRQKFQSTATQPDQLTAILDVYITNEQEKYFRQMNDNDDAEVSSQILTFDDTAFYQSLLRDLITTRSATSLTGDSLLSGPLILPTKLHQAGTKAKRKDLDTKASKGRKIRYTVHEKLQGFTAAEGDTGRDTAMWTERGKNEFFGSLFGQDKVLMEEGHGAGGGFDETDGRDSDAGNGNAEVEALRLFRT